MVMCGAGKYYTTTRSERVRTGKDLPVLLRVRGGVPFWRRRAVLDRVAGPGLAVVVLLRA